MTPITRTLLALAAIGTGVIHIALAFGTALPLALLFAVLGALELGWGTLCLVRRRIIAPRTALGVAIVPVLAWALLLVVSSVFESPGIAAPVTVLPPVVVSSLFELLATAAIGGWLRGAREPRGRPPGLTRSLLGIGLGAVMIVGLTTPAVAATRVGSFAAPSPAAPAVTGFQPNPPENSEHSGH